MTGRPDLRIALDAASKLRSPVDYARHLARLQVLFTHGISVLPDGKERMAGFNCFAYAVGLWDHPSYIRAVDANNSALSLFNSSIVGAMIDDGSIEELSLPLAAQGDLVVYFDGDKLKHAGVIASSSPRLVIRSKWGGNEVHQHGLWEVPAQYGNRVRAFRAPDVAACLERLVSN